MKLFKYFSAYTSIYEKALDDLLARGWLFMFRGGLILSRQIFNLVTSVWIFGVNFNDALYGDKIKIYESVKNSNVGAMLLKFPWGIFSLGLMIVGENLLSTLVESFFEAVIFKTLVKGPKINSSIKEWIIRNGKKYYRSLLFINLSVILIMVLFSGVGMFLLSKLVGPNWVDLKNGIWVKYFLPSLFFLAWVPVRVWVNIAKARIVADEEMSIAFDKAWKKVKVGGYFVLKGYLLFSVVYSGLWFVIDDLISNFEVSFKWFHWVGYCSSLVGLLLAGTYFEALYCRFSSEKIPSFAKR